jgi:hypothetical protein
MRRLLPVLVPVVVLLAAGCAGGDDEDSAAGEATTVSESASDAGSPGGGDAGDTSAVVVERAAQVLGAGRSVIRTAELEVRADDVAAAARQAVRIAEAAGGSLAEQDSTGGDEPTARVVLRVPPERFAATLDELATLGEVTATRVGTDDVTEVVVDLEGRLAGARASVERLRQLFRDAGDVPSVVAVEAELARREGEVEALAGQLRALGSQVDLATVTVHLSGGASAASAAVSEGLPGFQRGLRTGWAAFVDVAGAVATALGFGLPFLAVAVAVGGPVLWLRRRAAGPRTGTAG